MWRVQNMRSGEVVASSVEGAQSFWGRLRGLMLRSYLPPGHGLLLRPCNAIHTFFMRFPIDAIYLDATGRVLRIDRALAPWRIARPCPGARAVLELPAGGAAMVRAGDRLCFHPIDGRPVHRHDPV